VSSLLELKQPDLFSHEVDTALTAFFSPSRTGARKGGSRSKSASALSASKLTARERALLFGTSGSSNSPSGDVPTTTCCSGFLGDFESVNQTSLDQLATSPSRSGPTE
jgi:hypothetical protein